MDLEAHSNQSPPMTGVTLKKGAIPLVMSLVIVSSIARAQSPQIVTLRLGPDQIGVVKTTEKFSTRLAFHEPIKEVICGDLYDPESGTGAFVVQRIDNNVFIKPVAPKGISNMFVKTGERGERIYNFSLLIVPIDQVYFIVNVINPTDNIGFQENKSKQKESLQGSPPNITSIKMNEGAPGSSPGSIADVIAVKWSRLAKPEEPPPPPNMKSHSRAPGIVARSDSIPQREVIKRVRPNYPELARIASVSGEVIVEITVDDSGKVTSADAISGPVLLRSAAVLAARSWKFSPATPGQKPKLDVSRITFNFQPPKL